MINDKQFIISTDFEIKEPSWENMSIPNSSWILSWHPDLPIYFSNDKSIILIGYAWQVQPGKESPIEIIKNKRFPEGRIIEEENTWCGRYVLIINGNIYLDASGCLGVFYSEKFISSSLNLLVKYVKGNNFNYPRIKHGINPDFYPGINVGYEDCFRLMPSQSYNFVTQEIKARKLLPSGIFTIPEANIKNIFINCFCTSLENMASYFSNSSIYVAITGGYDSRTLMALCEKAKINYTPFTLEVKHMSKGDRIIPQMLVSKTDKNHIYIQRNKNNFSKLLYDNYHVHTAGMAVDEDWLSYAYGQYEKLKEGKKQIVLLRSSVWGIAIEFYTNKKSDGDLTLNKIEEIYKGVKINKDFSNSIKDWLKFYKNDIINFEVESGMTRLFHEMREGCWLSSIEQGFDIMEGIVSIQPCNSRIFLSLLLSLPKEKRKIKQHEVEITNEAYPNFSSIPYGNIYEKSSPILTKIKYLMSLLSFYGVKNTYHYLYK